MLKRLLSIGKKSQFKDAVIDRNVKEVPNVRSVKLKAKMRDEDLVYDKLSSLSYLKVEKEGKEVIARHVETVDLKDTPHKFWTLTFRPHEFEITYTYLESSKLKRINQILTAVCDVLVLVIEGFEVSFEDLLMNFRIMFDTNYAELNKGIDAHVREKEQLKSKIEELDDKIGKLQETNSNLTSEVHKLNAENEKLKLRISKLEVLDDASLKVRVQNWLETHDYSIDISKFAKTYDLSEPRVEEILDELAKEGFIKGRKTKDGEYGFQNVVPFENSKSFEKGQKEHPISETFTKLMGGKKK